MPGFDKTGPEGKGPLTGLKQGPCNKKWNQNDSCSRQGRGMRLEGRGRNVANPPQK